MTYVTRNATKHLGLNLAPILLGDGSPGFGVLVLVLAAKTMLDLGHGYLKIWLF
ncbi:MAG: hypothetical protein ACK456_00705 [Pseudanabaenaceae cyanobacterium]|jgi:hypothetical protein